MAKRQIDPEEWRRQSEESVAFRERLAARIAYIEQQIAERDAALAEWEARHARRAARVHRILTLGLRRAA
jgi:hypothetical protein